MQSFRTGALVVLFAPLHVGHRVLKMEAQLSPAQRF